MKDKTIIFFDGLCELCSRFVNFVLKRDKNEFFLFTSLQGETAKKYVSSKDIKNLKSIIVFEKGDLFKESRALKIIFKKLYPRISFFMFFIPPFIFNIFYRWIAKRRYNWFGKREQIYQIPQDLKKHFIP
ncbi:MAG: DUF393 domain-containing protein [Bdellovibrionales bacterium]|nr:DUF393 domain-containing protein [Bdellovibrionales bacterium]